MTVAKPKKKQNALTGIIIGFLVVVLAVYPLVFNSASEFSGTDDQAVSVIAELAPDYVPWVDSLFKPPSSEIENLLFCLQAALGAGVVGYYLAYARYSKDKDEE
ncbi:MAG: energy-coupling factor ABC transporter substrate-binding protein [Actinobacteria bacterium]|nr:energy-coupling factor ABC transporter substrate-binding protein [Actinomycetota bacterium]